MNNPYGSYYMGVDPNMYGTPNMIPPNMAYPGQGMMPMTSNHGLPPPMLSPADMSYDQYLTGGPYGFPESSHHTSGSASTTQDFEEEIDSDDRQGATSMPSRYAGQSVASHRRAGDGSNPSPSSSDGEKMDSHDEKMDDGNAQMGASPKKKPRITLARGGACVNCRNRKLKCTGERPCKTCKKSGIDCRYEELTRRRPRAVLMEERVAELEQLLAKSGIPVPPSPLNPVGTSTGQFSLLTPQYSPSVDSFSLRPDSSHASSQSSSVMPLAPRPDVLNVGTNQSAISIPPNSALELGLINTILPYTPYISVPLHAPRFLASLALPAGHPSRPHPALLYVLFAEAVRVIEGNTPLPQPRSLPPGLFGVAQTPIVPTGMADRAQLYSQVHGSSLSLIARAQRELNDGIRNVDRPFDLVRAALGISRYLYTLGRFIEGWNIPVARLAVTCGLHRLTGATVQPDPSSSPVFGIANPGVLPPPYSSTVYYLQHQQMSSQPRPTQPNLRRAPVILPPARDDIEVAERSATWWAVKAMDWSASIGWGWVGALHDSECTATWPWGWNTPEAQSDQSKAKEYTIDDLFSPSSSMHQQHLPESTYVLSIMSLCLLQRASSLFDRPSKRYAASGTRPSEFLQECASLDTACVNLRKRIPPAFQHPVANMPMNSGTTPGMSAATYDGPSDPWWIQLHINLYTTEMLLFSELSSHRSKAYDQAIASARAIVPFVRQVRPEQWAHIEMVTPICLSLTARFLNKESARLNAAGQTAPAAMAADDAETLRVVLERDIAQWLPMAGLHAMIVRRVKEGWPEKEGEYERI